MKCHFFTNAFPVSGNFIVAVVFGNEAAGSLAINSRWQAVPDTPHIWLHSNRVGGLILALVGDAA